MIASSLFFLRTLLLLWIFCAVVCEHSKRDVRRIIIKDRFHRSHKKGHHGHGHSHRGRGRSRGHSHSGRDHSHGHKNKAKKHKHSSEEEGSFEDAEASRENSFEDKFHSYKAHKSHRHPKTSRRRPSHASSSDYEASKLEPFREDSGLHYHSDWLPLSSELMQRFSSLEDFRQRRNKRKDGKHRKDYLHALKPPPVELTTSYPFQLDTTSIFPQLSGFANPFSNWNYNQKIFQSSHPLIGTIEQPIIQLEENSDRLKNHRTSYEDEARNLNTFISVPEDSSSISKEEESKSNLKIRSTEQTTTTTTIKPSISRGRNNYRGYKKH